MDDRRLPDQNRIASMWLSWHAVKEATQRAEVKRNDKPDSNISQLWLLREAVMDTNPSSLMYFTIV